MTKTASSQSVPTAPDSATQSEINRLSAEMRALQSAVTTLNNHRFMKMHNKTSSLILMQFLRGLALGLGTALGASVLLSVTALLLSQVEFVPILGDLATQVIGEIEKAQRGPYVPTEAPQPAPAPIPEAVEN